MAAFLEIQGNLYRLKGRFGCKSIKVGSRGCGYCGLQIPLLPPQPCFKVSDGGDGQILVKPLSEEVALRTASGAEIKEDGVVLANGDVILVGDTSLPVRYIQE